MTHTDVNNAPSQAFPPTSQWQRLLKNIGTWQGSFTQLSPSGQVLADVPTEVALIPQDDGSAMQQEIRRYASYDYTEKPTQVTTLNYRTLSRATRFFEDGAFSQGSLQWGPFSEFGAELGLIAGERRLRLVQLFGTTGELEKITLIRERLQGTTAPERNALTLTDLVGTWIGEAVTQYADLRPEISQRTQLMVERMGDRTIRQTIQLEDAPPISSTGIVTDQIISFTEGTQPMQVLLLPAGASATCPPHITPRQSLFLEVGWLLDTRTRQRMIRRYDAAGAWTSLTLVNERKV
ncbi:MAG: DUF3598 family protein [Phormidesmis sp.]